MIMFNLSTIGMLVYREVILPICSLQWKHLLLQFENVVVEFFGVIISYVLYNVCYVILKTVNGQSLYDDRMIGCVVTPSLRMFIWPQNLGAAESVA